MKQICHFRLSTVQRLGIDNQIYNHGLNVIINWYLDLILETKYKRVDQCTFNYWINSLIYISEKYLN